MYLYLLYLIGWYAYEEETVREKESGDTPSNCKFVEEYNKQFPKSETIIKNRDKIIDKEKLRSGYKDVVLELKEKFKNNPNMIKD